MICPPCRKVFEATAWASFEPPQTSQMPALDELGGGVVTHGVNTSAPWAPSVIDAVGEPSRSQSPAGTVTMALAVPGFTATKPCAKERVYTAPCVVYAPLGAPRSGCSHAESASAAGHVGDVENVK